MGYRKLQIYSISFELFLKTHKESLRLPKYETYELGSQLRRSSGSVVANIVEGYTKQIQARVSTFFSFLTCQQQRNDVSFKWTNPPLS